MLTYFILFILLFTSCSSSSGSTSVEPSATAYAPLTFISDLHDDVVETSGLLNIDGRLYTHNDSGDSALLYELNATTGDIVRRVIVNGADNVDWEDVAYGDRHIYIADSGNNMGSRTDLKIYKILKSDLNASNSVDAQEISFSYAEQTIFDYDRYSTPYDAEALIVYDEELYIFTKNWENRTTKIYKIPTQAGSYVLESIGEYTFDVMITGATVDEQSSLVVLVGYSVVVPYKSMIIKLSDFSQANFFSGTISTYEIINTQGITQIEAIVLTESSEFYLTSEGVNANSAKLYKVELNE